MTKFLHGIVTVALVLGAGCATVDHPDDRWFGRDKAYHCAAAAVIGAGVTALVSGDELSDVEAGARGTGAAVIAGASKEWFDRGVRKTYWSWKDLVWDLIGGLAGSFAAAAADD
jgi:uncharacterized protein YfiM (DUF2279 family)